MNRKLVLIEQIMCKLSETHPVNGGMVVRVEGEIDLLQLREGLRKVQLRHPLLAVRVEEQNGDAYFESNNVPEIPLRVMENARAEDWKEEMNRELVTPFNCCCGPLVRFVWIKNVDYSDLLMVCHHAVTDGYSVVNCFRDLLKFISDPLLKVVPLELLPASGDMLHVTGKMKFQAQIARLVIRLILLKRFIKPQRSIKLPRKMEYHLHPWMMNEQETQELVARARQEKTSVHAAIGVAFMRAFAEFDTIPEPQRWKRRISSPVSIRKHLNTNLDESFGLYVSLKETTANCHPDLDFWEITRAVKADLLKQTDAKKIVTGAFVIGSIKANDIKGIDFPVKKYDLSITNLGRIDFPEHFGALRVKSFYGPIAAAAENENVLGVLTMAGRIHFLFITDHVTLSNERTELIIANAMKYLRQAMYN